jgi:hypothetical protein
LVYTRVTAKEPGYRGNDKAAEEKFVLLKVLLFVFFALNGSRLSLQTLFLSSTPFGMAVFNRYMLYKIRKHLEVTNLLSYKNNLKV